MRKRIDCYGRAEGEPNHGTPLPCAPTAERRVAGVAYMCFGDGERRAIHRMAVDETGLVRRMWAWGRWEEAELLDYTDLETRKVVDA